jgi:hypothetical protein
MKEDIAKILKFLNSDEQFNIDYIDYCILMLVWDKIEKIGFETHISGYMNWKLPYRVAICDFKGTIIASHESDSRIESIWKCIVEFIDKTQITI